MNPIRSIIVLAFVTTSLAQTQTKPLDAGKIDLARKGVKRTDNDFAVIWAKNFGKGRVLYNGLGHVQAVWERPDFQKMWLEMIQWSMGLVPGDATPRAKPNK